MRLLIDRWLTGPASLRAACAGGWLALLAGVAYGCLAPLVDGLRQREAQFAQQSAALHTLQQQRAALPDRQREATVLEAQLARRRFHRLRSTLARTGISSAGNRRAKRGSLSWRWAGRTYRRYSQGLRKPTCWRTGLRCMPMAVRRCA